VGLFTFYLGYRKGRRRAERRAERDASWGENPDGEDVCDNCGYRESQHSDEGLCPDYGI
jgi:hypothetical protein